MKSGLTKREGCGAQNDCIARALAVDIPDRDCGFRRLRAAMFDDVERGALCRRYRKPPSK
jgi:hypothetical protein